MSSDLFLTDEQEQHVIKAIARAEKQTSGEIRIHLEFNCPGDPLKRAQKIFHELGMDETRLQNGVLIYLAAEDHKAAVFAGRGIYEKVEEHFWDKVLSLLIDHFKRDEFERGIMEAVEQVGEQLRKLFPYHQKGSVNELTNEISYKDNRNHTS